VAAPELPEGGLGRHALKSSDPASLYNACRVAAHLADKQIGPWGQTRWSQSRRARRDSIMLMHSLKEDMPLFEELLLRERPDLLLIGAMSVCLPGAIACAARASDEVFIASTSGGITPVISVDSKPLPQEGFGPVSARLVRAYWEKHSDPEWTTPVE
jgi:hypothetical protein